MPSLVDFNLGSINFESVLHFLKQCISKVSKMNEEILCRLDNQFFSWCKQKDEEVTVKVNSRSVDRKKRADRWREVELRGFWGQNRTRWWVKKPLSFQLSATRGSKLLDVDRAGNQGDTTPSSRTMALTNQPIHPCDVDGGDISDVCV